MRDDTVRRGRELYCGLTDLADNEIGKVLAALHLHPEVAENTMTIYSLDHGEKMGEQGLWWKNCMYEQSSRVSLITSWPKHFQGRRKIESLVELVDITPTLLEAAAIPVPAGVQGRSLMPLLTGQTTTHRDSVYMEYFDANPPFQTPPMLTGVRTEKFKLSFYDKPITGELYDLQNDPGEVTNLCDDPPHKDTSNMMLPILAGRMIEATDPLPEGHSSW